VHFIKQGKVDMADGYFGLHITAQPFGYLSGYPVLAERSLNENIQRHNQEEQRQKKPLQYFFKSPQIQSFKL
jgi:hypothetical protein